MRGGARARRASLPAGACRAGGPCALWPAAAMAWWRAGVPAELPIGMMTCCAVFRSSGLLPHVLGQRSPARCW